MPKKILSVGFEIPGGEIDAVELTSNRSLLDADIIVYQPRIPDRNHQELSRQALPH
jgi:hypothetical protein